MFLPAAFVPGITGQFYRQFALTIAASMVISAINAMTLTPARAVAIFKTESGGHAQREALPWWIFGVFGGFAAWHWGPQFLPASLQSPSSGTVGRLIEAACFVVGTIAGGVAGRRIIHPVNDFLSWVFRGFNRLFDRITEMYGWTVGRALRLSAMVLVVYVGLLFLTGWSMAHAPTGFIPTQDQGYLLVNAQLPDSWSVQETQKVVAKIDKIARGDPNDRQHYPGMPGVAHVLDISGQSFLLSANGSNFGSAYVILEPFEDRRQHDRYDAVIAEKLRELCAREIPDAVITVFRAPPIQGLGTAGGFKLQVEQRGFVNLQELQAETDKLVAAGNKDPRLVGLFTIYRANAPQVYLDIDRTKCQSLDVDVQEAFNTLQVYMGGYYVNLFNKFGRTWQVNLLADQSFRGRPAEVGNLKVRNKLGEMVPLGTLADVQRAGGPVIVMRYNMYASAPVNGNTAPGVSSGQAVGIMADLAKKQGLAFEWTEITFMQILAGNTGIYVFALGALLIFSDSRRQVRKLATAARRDPGRADVFAVFRGRHVDRRAAGRHLCAGRVPGAGGTGGQERHPHRRVRQAIARGRQVALRCDGRGLPAAAAADHHDGLRVHSRRRAASAGRGRRGGNAPLAGHRRVQRHDRRDRLRHLPHAGLLLRYQQVQANRDRRRQPARCSRRSPGAS